MPLDPYMIIRNVMVLLRKVRLSKFDFQVECIKRTEKVVAYGYFLTAEKPQI